MIFCLFCGCWRYEKLDGVGGNEGLNIKDNEQNEKLPKDPHNQQCNSPLMSQFLRLLMERVRYFL